MSIELYVPFVAKELGLVPEQVRPEFGDARRVQELLWPVASFFATVAGIADYQASAEAEADAVLEALEADPSAWGDFSSDAARVLKDRTTYALTVLEANARADEPVICPPVTLTEEMQRAAMALLWLHRTVIPSELSGRQQ